MTELRHEGVDGTVTPVSDRHEAGLRATGWVDAHTTPDRKKATPATKDED